MAGMSTGTADKLNNEPNVVPMIDVLLVLLVIFMMIVPMSRKAIDLQLPDPTPQPNQGPPPSQIVMEVLPGNRFLVNKEPVPREQLGRRLKAIFDPRPEKIIFVKGDPAVKYSDVMWSMDVARGAGVRVIGVPPKETN